MSTELRQFSLRIDRGDNTSPYVFLCCHFFGSTFLIPVSAYV